jgi:rod shape determining protein RodA
MALTARTSPRQTSRPTTALRAPGIDWLLLAAVLALLALGSLLVWSATSARDDLTGGDPRAYLQKQLVNVAIGLVLMVMVTATDHRWVRILAPVAYLASVGGLVLVLTSGSTINGSRSWIQLGSMSIQPAELAKLAVVIGMALIVAERAEGRRRHDTGWVDVVGMLVIAGIPATLIMLQPDLGTMLVLSATVFGVVAASGASRRWLVLLVVGAAMAAVAAVTQGLLKAYQVDRFLAFTDPDLDPRGAGYNTEQARIAVGNGGLFGEGLFHGSQTRSGFVPEQHTDFIFTVAGEELGLVGATLLIGLLAVVIWRALAIAFQTDDVFGRIAAAGIACWFGFQTFQNVGMCLGIMPVTGVPLPFVSYGGSSMFAGMLAVGLLQNIHLRSTARLPTRYAAAPRVLAR